MKNKEHIGRKIILLSLSLTVLLSACSNSDADVVEGFSPDQSEQLTLVEKESLLFMMEEERLARDVYNHLYDRWRLNQFQNITISEQSHMDAVENLLLRYGIDYTILDPGIFQNEELQVAYTQLIAQGDDSLIGALISGATIEDLDIYDLENWIHKIENLDIINVFSNLQCGSRNHLRSFNSSLDSEGGSYIPVYISQLQFDQIINTDREKCN